jgi:tRNA pseudouridine55 synthase
MARKNREIERSAVNVNIYNISISRIDLPFVEIDVECSKGTYIRSLADDIGREIGCGGYLYRLRRRAIGEYDVGNALQISEIVDKIKSLNN